MFFFHKNIFGFLVCLFLAPFGMAASALPEIGAEASIVSAPLTCHFLWIYKDAYDAQKHQGIHPDKHLYTEALWESDSTKLPSLKGWREAHPGAVINLWYDGGLVAKKQISFTKQFYKGFKINLKDLREFDPLTLRSDLNQYLLNPKVPVYIRADLVRLMVLWDHVSREDDKASFHLYADLDTKPISALEQLPEETKQFLETLSVVFSRGADDNIFFAENHFILAKTGGAQSEKMQKAFHWMIGLNVERVRRSCLANASDSTKNIFSRWTPHQIYNDYQAAFLYYLALIGEGYLTTRSFRPFPLDGSFPEVELDPPATFGPEKHMKSLGAAQFGAPVTYEGQLTSMLPHLRELSRFEEPHTASGYK